MKDILKKLQDKMILIIVVILVLAGMIAVLATRMNATAKTPEEIKLITEDFINTNLLQGENKAAVTDVALENGLYKMKVTINGEQEIDSYMTKDGKTFFPQALEIKKTEEEGQQADTQADAAEKQQAANVEKSDKPSVELFVMSHCPYGTQIEKGIIPAVEALGNKIDFSLKFCDYAMHGEKEVNEQLAETCIAKEQKDKLFPYLKCFLKDGNSEACLKEAKIDASKMKNCVAKLDKEFEVTKKLNDKSTWISGQFPPFDVFAADNEKYGVQGSPTLVINGAAVSSSRDAQSLLASICSGFNNAPDECQKELPSAAPSPGFGEGTGSDTEAGCRS